MDRSMLSISAYETVGNQIAWSDLDRHLPAGVYRDQGPGGWRVGTQFACAPDFRGRQLFHWYRPQLRRPLVRPPCFGPVTCGDMSAGRPLYPICATYILG